MYKLKPIKKTAKKKVALKKAAPKKKVAKKSAYKLVRKKVARKKAAPSKLKSLHKDSKSHNVNIKVMSGMGSVKKISSEDYNRYREKIERVDGFIFSIDQQLKNPRFSAAEKKSLRQAKKDYKTLRADYKFYLSQIKKRM
jgi:hypothetical protein